MKNLYFIAIYPPQQIIDEIKIFKEDLARNYQNSKATKNDAHITLFPPFSREAELENDIIEAFERIDTHLPPFEVVLNGFGSFPNPKNPVIFVHPEYNPHLTDLYHRVKKEFSFGKGSFTPHMTVGYRDLSMENYLKAWKIYQNKTYKNKFTVDKILVLRYEGRWVPIKEKKLQ